MIVGSSLVGAWRDGRGWPFLSPTSVERLRSFLLARETLRDATMVSVLAYAGLRPRELLTLRWSDIGKRSLRVRGGTANGAVQRSRRVPLLEPVAEDLALWREACKGAEAEALAFPPSPGIRWSDDDWAAWRKRVFRPAVRSCGMEMINPMHLRNTFCGLSLLQGMPIRRVAHQMGTTAGEIREGYELLRRNNLLDGSRPPVSAEEEIRQARRPRSPLDGVPPFALFRAVTDDAWRWLHLEGRNDCPFLGSYLPGLTGDVEFESLVVGSGGTEALAQGFEIYALFKQLYEKHAKPLTSQSRVLDFGCGWGRVIRFFLKDVAPESLVGIDVDPWRLAACRETNRWAQFHRCKTFPPTKFEPDSFDLVYAFSVFSHLSEKVHRRWLEEFERLLRPGGVLILTTFPRTVLESHADGDPLQNFSELARRFAPVEESLSAYDRGEFCYRVLNAKIDIHFGDALIPEQYVREHWTKHFLIREYFGFPAVNQNVIVCRKRKGSNRARSSRQ